MPQAPTAAPGLTARTADRFFRTRWLVRMPIGLYRAGLGFLFGKRLLMLEHTGRNSGARRRVVLEVLARPAMTPAALALPGVNRVEIRCDEPNAASVAIPAGSRSTSRCC